MRSIRLLLGVFSLSLIVGLASAVLLPEPVSAEEDPCSSTCYADFCPGPVGPNCTYPYSKRNRCYEPNYAICEGDYSCRCVFTGCCIIS